MKPFNKFSKSSKYGSKFSGSSHKSYGSSPKTYGTKRFSKDDDEESNFDRFSAEGRGNSEGRSADGRGKLELHEATCNECGNKCEVPFKPTGNKPIYCRSCFKKREGSEDFKPRSSDREGPKFDPRPRYGDSRPRSNFRDAEPRNWNDDSGSEKPRSDELDKINKKLDKIMKALKIE
jgi:CxxC-x17-CxxC domain-containing protein